jgi:hypothetical protein
MMKDDYVFRPFGRSELRASGYVAHLNLVSLDDVVVFFCLKRIFDNAVTPFCIQSSNTAA